MRKEQIRFGPAGLGPVKTALAVLEQYHSKGLKACEIAFTYGAYIKSKEDAEEIGEKAKELGIKLSIHGHYWINLNSKEKAKIEASKERILECCKVADWLGAQCIVFHPGFYNKDVSEKGKEECYDNVREAMVDILKEIKKNKWQVEICPETTGKINVFGSVEEISKIAKETGCGFCIDFAHILAREKRVDFDKIGNAFPQKEWHCHFSGIIYNEKGERHHKTTGKEEWENLFENLKKIAKDKEIIIINESPTLIEDSVEGLKIWEKMN